MTFNWLYRLGDWNPQLFREAKGRLKPKTLYATVAVSLMSQLLLLLYFRLVLPVTDTFSHRYCTGSNIRNDLMYAPYDDGLPECLRGMDGNPLVNWPLWWSDIFQALSWALPFVLLTAGVYLLIGDLAKEERRGTLNFIRLSPQTSQKLLIGKLLGVPIVPYLAVALALPLHLIAAVSASVTATDVLSVYLLTITVAGFFYAGSLLYSLALEIGPQAWITIIVWLSYSGFFLFFQFSGNPLYWYYLSIRDHLGLWRSFVLLTFGVGTFWLWQAVNRRFHNPKITLFSKRQSYLITACLELWLLGFVHHSQNSWPLLLSFAAIASLNLLWFTLLIAALTPKRQMLLDWARYRRGQINPAKQFVNRSILQDLIWGETSPIGLAIGVNLLIAASLFIPWVLTWGDQHYRLAALATLLLGGLFVLIGSVITQSELLLKSPSLTAGVVSVGWLFSVLASVLTLAVAFVDPTSISSELSENPASVLAFVAFLASKHVAARMVFLFFLGHLSVLSLLTMRLARQLRQAGESESKALPTDSKR